MGTEQIYYKDIPHQYYGVKTGLEYESVSRVFNGMKAYTDWEGILIGSAKKQGVSPEYLQAEWDRKKDMGTRAGTKVHADREKWILESFVVELGGSHYIPVPYSVDSELDDVKYQTQDIGPGHVYPELILSLQKDHMRVAGTSDEVYIDYDNFVHIVDTKTDKSIEYEGFRGKTLSNGLEHRQDCNYDAYSLKCSLYMYMLLRSHPELKPGSITLRYTPILRDDEGCAVIHDDGDVTVLGVEYITVDYSKNEGDVKTMLNHFYKNSKKWQM